MSEYKATISWERNEASFTDNRYSRGHKWFFDGGITVPASASPHVVPKPFSIEEAVDPEEAFVASISSCHMLFFLSIAAKRGYQVDSYVDEAIGIMSKDEHGKFVMSQVILRPQVTFSGHKLPQRDDIDEIHHESHHECYIANSVKTEIVCQPVIDD